MGKNLAVLKSAYISIESSFLPPKHVIPQCVMFDQPNHSNNKKTISEDDWDIPEGSLVRPIFSGAFLSHASRQELMRVIEPQYRNIVADHLTFCAAINNNNNLHKIIPHIGKTCTLRIDRHKSYTVSPKNSEKQVDCVKVEAVILDETNETLMPLVASGYPHITLSTDINTQAKASLDLLVSKENEQSSIPNDNEGDNTDNIIYLHAVVGLVVEERADLLAGLTQKVKNQINDFISGRWIMGEQLRFSPGELSSAERAVIHKFAESKNLESRSEGNKNMRKLILVKKRLMGLDDAEDTSNSEEVKYNNQRVFKCGNEAIDEEAESQRKFNKKKKKCITDKSQCIKLQYDFGNGRVVSGLISEKDVITSQPSEKDDIKQDHGPYWGDCYREKWSEQDQVVRRSFLS